MIQATWGFVEKYYIDDLAERDLPESRWALSWLKEVKGKNVLSLGCGPNFYDDAQFFSNLPEEFVGIDLNKNNLEFLTNSNHPEVLRCSKLLEDRGTKIQLLHADIREKRKKFINHLDTVYATGVLGMFEKKGLEALLRLVHSYLRPGGRLVDIDWADCRLSGAELKERSDYEWWREGGPSAEGAGRILVNAGFKILKRGVYAVPNSEEYKWGKIYAYVAKKLPTAERRSSG